jgi:hypothetical protein
MMLLIGFAKEVRRKVYVLITLLADVVAFATFIMRRSKLLTVARKPRLRGKS